MNTNPKALKPGTLLKGEGEVSYRIERVLGAGGFGITYLATENSGSNLFQKYVAIKEHFPAVHCVRGKDGTSMICPGTEDSRKLVAATLKDFKAEARRLKKYSGGHYNIVKVQSVFEANDTAYYVMEYIAGETLDSCIYRNGGLPEYETVKLLLPITEALAYLHSHRITHLDIKPGNIMLQRFQVDHANDLGGFIRPVLIDFGLSKHYNEDGTATSTVNTTACSHGYSPIEQYAGITSFCPPADVYALGATFLHSLTGKRPPKANEMPEGQPADTISSLPISDNLKQILISSMASKASARYPDANTLLEDIVGYKESGFFGASLVSMDEIIQGTPIALGAALIDEGPAPIPDAEEPPEDYNTPHHLDLAVLRNGETVYFNRNDWKISLQSGDRKLGIVIDKYGQKFILALDDLNSGMRMDWNSAMRRYLSDLPDMAQTEALTNQFETVNAALSAYGGTPMNWTDSDGDSWPYWTKSEFNAASAWYVNMRKGYFKKTYKTFSNRVRAVLPLPEINKEEKSAESPAIENQVELKTDTTPVKPGKDNSLIAVIIISLEFLLLLLCVAYLIL